jgi:hypothetical protein
MTTGVSPLVVPTFGEIAVTVGVAAPRFAGVGADSADGPLASQAQVKTAKPTTSSSRPTSPPMQKYLHMR